MKRPLKVKIEIYLDEKSSITGEDETQTLIRDAVFDLEEVEAIWITAKNCVRVELKSRNSFCVTNYTYDQLYDLVFGNVCALPPPNIFTGATSGEPLQHVGVSAGKAELCVFCGGTDIIQEGLTQICNGCGMSWTKENNFEQKAPE